MSEHTQTDDGLLTQDNVDVSKSTQAQTSMAEDEILFQHLLGIRLPEDIDSHDLANQISLRICTTIDSARHGMNQADLSHLLEERINHALERLHTDHHDHGFSNTEQLQRISLLADAVRESVPENILRDFMRNGMPVAIDSNPDVPRHHVRMNVLIDGGPVPIGIISTARKNRDVTIDMRHSFWRERTFADTAALATDLVGKTLEHVGITISNPSDIPASYQITQADANRIVGARIRIVNLNQRFPAFNSSVSINGQQRSIRVDVAGLVAAYVDAPANLSGRVVGSLSEAQLIRYLMEDSNWDWVQGLQDIGGRDLITVGTNPPIIAARYIAQQLRIQYGSATPPNGIFTNEHTIFEIQKEQHTQHQFDSRLREGSDNSMGAAMATALAMRYHDLRDVMLGRDRAVVDTELNTARQNQQFADLLESTDALTLPTGLHSYADLEGALVNITTARGLVGTVAVGNPVTINASGTVPAESMTVPARSGTIADYGPVYVWLDKKREEIQKEIRPYQEIEARLTNIANLCTFNGITGTAIQTIIANARATPRNTTGINQTMNINALTDAIRGIRNFGTKKKADFDKDIERLQKEQADIISGKAVGPHGDVAQNLLIKEYLKRYRGLSESEAMKTTNHIRARSKLDGDLDEAANEVTAELFGHERLNMLKEYFSNVPKTLSLRPGSPERQSRRIIYQIAYASHVPMKPNTYSRNFFRPANHLSDTPEPNWSKAKYGSLIESYFAMKNLYEGKGPARLKLQQTNYLMRQMNEISRALMAKHAHTFIKDFGPSLGMTEEEAREKYKELSKEELANLFKETLQGDAPAKYKGKIDHAIHFADEHTNWGRHTFLTNDKYGMLYGKKNKISARNVLYGNKYASIAGLGYRTPVAAGKYVGKTAMNAADGLWRRKWSIAAGAAIGTLFLPGLGTAAGAWIAGSRAKVAGGGHAVHADAHGDGHGGDGHGDGHGGDGHGDGHGDSHGH